ncbi:hypothetical protein SGLAM104S_05799 [Streptomyces glaucescens]
MHLVAVGAAEGDRLAVDPHQAVLEGELPQADPVREGLGHPSGGVAQLEDGGVEVGVLGRPEAGPGDGPGGLDGGLAAGRDVDGLLEGAAPDGAAVGVVQHDVDRVPSAVHGIPSTAAGMPSTVVTVVPPGLPVRAHLRRDLQLGRRAVVAERGVQLEVPQVHGRGGVQVDRAEDAAQPDHVLVLQPVPVGVAVDLDGDLVGARLQKPGDVVLGGGVRVLAVARQLAVDPDVVSGLHPLEVEEGPPSRPVPGQGEGAPVLADRVVPGGGGGRLGVLAEAVGAPPGVGDVDVDRAVVAVQLPGGGDGQGVPVAVVEVGAVEVGVTVVGALGVGELPGAVEAEPVRRPGAVGGQGLVEVAVRHQGGVRRFGAQPEDVDAAVPLRAAVRCGGEPAGDGPAACAVPGDADRASAPRTAAPPSSSRRRLTNGRSAGGSGRWACGAWGCGMTVTFLGWKPSTHGSRGTSEPRSP